MPFKSQAQRRFMYAKHPDIAKRWSSEYGPQKNLPEHVSEPKKLARVKAMRRLSRMGGY